MKEIVDSELFAKKLPDTWKNPDIKIKSMSKILSE